MARLPSSGSTPCDARYDEEAAVVSPSERRVAKQQLVTDNRAAIQRARAMSQRLGATVKEYERVQREVLPRLRKAGLVR